MRTLSASLLALLMASVLRAGQEATVPFVGCPADGQVGFAPPPSGQPKAIPLAGVPAGAFAYYKGEYAPGAFAPRGWHCRVWYGSSGGALLITPGPIVTTNVPRTSGPAVQMSISVGGTSGRFAVASYGSRLFPKLLGSFINAVKSEGLTSDSDYAPRAYALDSVRSVAPLVAEFTTPASVRGLGTVGLLAPANDPVYGVAILSPDSTEPDMTVLRVRLGARMQDLTPILLRLNRGCMQQPGGC